MFTDAQLSFIKEIARKQKNQGELSVAKAISSAFGHSGMSHGQLNIIQYCAEECKRQRSGEMSVYDMLNGWNWIATFNPDKLTITDIETLGQLIEPDDNRSGFRQIAVGVGNQFFWDEKADWHEVPRLLKLLLESYYEGNFNNRLDGNPIAKDAVDQFYFEYEEIHPFRDGNGRTGKILYNYLKGTLDNPIWPPMFWEHGVP